MILRYLSRLILLTLGFALTTKGILAWKDMGFDLSTLWPLAEVFSPHPVYVLVLGLALIPPTLWELFVLESSRESR